MSILHIYNHDNLTESNDSKQDIQSLYHHLYQLEHITERLNQQTDIDNLYRTAVASAKELLDIDRIGILLIDRTQRQATGTWGCDEHGKITAEHHFCVPIEAQLIEIIEEVDNKGKVCLWDNHPLYAFNAQQSGSTVIGLGWYMAIPIWERDTLIGWIACDNLLRRKEFKTYQSHIFRLFASNLCSCRDHLLAQQKIYELSHSLEEKVKTRTRQLAQVQNALEIANTELETRVAVNTKSLKLKNNQLEATISRLSNTENQLSLVKAHSAMKDLILGVAYQIKPPIQAAKDYAEQLQPLAKALKLAINKQDPVNIQALLQQKQDINNKLLAVINDIYGLDQEFDQLSDIEIESIPASEVELRDWISHTLTLSEHLEPNISKLNIEVNYNTSIKQLILHSEILQQVFKELLLNAYTHASQQNNTQVLINISIMNNNLFVTIEDDGVGIAPALQTEIFNHFISSKKELGHKGIGLNVAFNLVHFLIKGKLSYFDSKLGGAGFLIKCPIQLTSKTIQQQQQKNPLAFLKQYIQE